MTKIFFMLASLAALAAVSVFGRADVTPSAKVIKIGVLLPLKDGGPLLEVLAEVLGLPGDGGLFVLLDSRQRDVAGRDVLQVLGGQAGRELGGDAWEVGVRECRQCPTI